MKAFYSSAAAAPGRSAVDTVLAAGPLIRERDGQPLVGLQMSPRARVAVYDASSAAPHVVDVAPASIPEFIEALSTTIHRLCRDEGGSIPYTVIREVAENFIHADFAEPVVSILDAGATIRFADQGPGISDKERALLPGFTTARGEMKRYIRGVGSGLPIVREYLIHSGGSLSVEDNLGTGAVVTLYAGRSREGRRRPSEPSLAAVANGIAPVSAPSSSQSLLIEEPGPALPVASPRLSARQKHVLALVMESGLAGPSLVAKELGVGLSTAYRDLAMLEEVGLIVSESGKRTLTPEGLSFLGDLMNRS